MSYLTIKICQTCLWFGGVQIQTFKVLYLDLHLCVSPHHQMIIALALFMNYKFPVDSRATLVMWVLCKCAKWCNDPGGADVQYMCYCGTCRLEYIHSKAIPQMTQIQMCCFVSFNMMKSHQSMIRACHILFISQVRHRAKQCRQTANEAGMTQNYGSSLSFLISTSVHLCLWHFSIQLLVITLFYRILSAKSALQNLERDWTKLTCFVCAHEFHF